MTSGNPISDNLLMQQENITDVLKAADMGVWSIIYRDGYAPQLKISGHMIALLGIENRPAMTAEDLYQWWYERIYLGDLYIVQNSLNKLGSGERIESIYRWIHPTQGVRTARAGGIGGKNIDGAVVIKGYYFDVTERIEKQRQDAFVADAFARTYSCLLYMDLDKNRYITYPSPSPNVLRFLPERGRITEANRIIAEKLCAKHEYETVRNFMDIATINERLKEHKSISITVQGAYVKWVRLTLIVSDRNSDGTIFHMVGTIKDVSDHIDRELKLVKELKENIEANQSKTKMLQNMTHEIRTPLNAIFGFAQLLSMPDMDLSDEQKQEYFQTINNSFNILSMLIDDVMDITDAENGNYIIHKSAVAVNKTCRTVTQMAEMKVPGTVTLYFTSEVDDNYTTNTDERRLQQVLLNFLTNACKHTRQGEIRLHVSTTENPGHLTFSVTDTGTGVPADLAEDIFKRYKKAHYNIQGSGIGLHICSIIAEKLGADIKLDRSYTNGARFLLIL
jgi:signal transduction histidine kinase